jgi:molybdopterin-containing oxidoreductase family iron-sulfur binding subunit
VFGDLNDPESRVRKLHEDNRSYAMLGEINIKPRTQYLAKLRNPSPELYDDDGHDDHGTDDAHTGHDETHG